MWIVLYVILVAVASILRDVIGDFGNVWVTIIVILAMLVGSKGGK